MNEQEKRELLLALKDFDEKLTHFKVTDVDDYMGKIYVRTDSLSEYEHLINEIQPFKDLVIQDTMIDDAFSDLENDQRTLMILLTNNAHEYLGCDIDTELKNMGMIAFSELVKKEEFSIYCDTREKAQKLMEYLEKKDYMWVAGQKPTQYENFYSYGGKDYYTLNYFKDITHGSIDYIYGEYFKYENIIFDDGGDTLEQEQNVALTDSETTIETETKQELNKDLILEEILNENEDYVKRATMNSIENDLAEMKEYFGELFDDFDNDIVKILLVCSPIGRDTLWYVYKEYLNKNYGNLTNNDLETLYDNELVDTRYYKCDYCGELVDENHIHEVSGDYDFVCDSCYEDGFTCDRCGEWLAYIDDSYTVNTRNGQEYWCERCADNHAFWCNGYEEYYDDYYYSSYEVNGNTYSEDYCDNNFYWCEECENYVDGDDWDSDYDCCRWCAEDNHYPTYDRIAGYHDRPEQYLYGKVAKNVKSDYHHIGIELEIDKNNKNGERDLLIDLSNLYDINNHELYFNHDGSLDCGFEIITQPHTYKAFKEMNWKDILQKCIDYGYKSHDTSTCGLHLHISRELLGATKDKQDRAISKLMLFIDANWNDIVKVSRRKDDELRRWASKCRDYGTNKEIYTSKMATEDYKKNAKNKYAFGRYMALNNTNYGTVEFRFMKGTLKYESFMACIDFLYRIAINSKNIKYKDILNNKLWLKGISENTKAYLKQRNAFLDAISE